MDPKERIIVALDFDDLRPARELVDKLLPQGFKIYKVGLQLINRIGGPQVVSFLHHLGAEVFYDIKLHDIPETVAKAAKAISELGVKFFNVHASSGPEAVRRAAENKGDAKLLVVTVLTSLQFSDLWNIGLGRCRNPDCEKYATTEWDKKFVEELVVTMAKWAKAYGADGVICSPQELKALNKLDVMRGFLKVVPGVRPAGAAVNDQKRVMTPGEAIRAGADYLVIGRPITNPPAEIGGPVEAVKRIIEEIEGAQGGRP